MIPRRAVVIAVASALLRPGPAMAQTGKVPRVGFLSPSAPSPISEGFRRGLRDLGYVEGRNVLVVYRWAEGRFDRLPDLAAELVREDVNVIVTQVTQASLAARNATRTIPIVMIGTGDPVGVGLVESLSRPAGNITGTSAETTAVVGKSIQLLVDAVSGIFRVAALWNPANSVFQGQMVREAEGAARILRVDLHLVEARAVADLDLAVRTARQRADALIVLADPVFTIHRARLAELAAKVRLPAVYGIREAVEAGGLMSYGPDYGELARRSASYVDRILKGVRPADLPVEQPTKYELAVNLKAAKALDLVLPQSLLARADTIIQ